MFKLIKQAKSLLVTFALAWLGPANAESFNLYPYPIETSNGVAIVTTSYGDASTRLPLHFLGRNARLSTVSLEIGTVVPHAEVFWSPERADFVIVYGRNRRIRSGPNLGPMPCRLFTVQSGPTPQSQIEELDDTRCNNVLDVGIAGPDRRASLDWIGSTKGMARLNKETILRSASGNRVTIETIVGHIGDIFSYLDGAIILLDTGHFTATGSSYERLSLNMKGTSVSIAQFYDVFHRPDVVQAKLSGDDITAMTADLTVAKALRNPPPSVELDPIANTVKASRLPIKFTVKSNGGGIAEIRIFQNGKLISSDGYYKGSSQNIKEGLHNTPNGVLMP